jgi:hypothetical protein
MEGWSMLLANVPAAELQLVVVALGSLFVGLVLLEDQRLRRKRSAQIVAGISLAITAMCFAILVSAFVFESG